MIDIAFIPNSYNSNVFSSISMDSEAICVSEKNQVLTQFVTEFPRILSSDMQPNNFAFTYFDTAKVDFTKNQDVLNLISNSIFGHTQPLDDFEQSILNKSFNKSLKSIPSRLNRL